MALRVTLLALCAVALLTPAARADDRPPPREKERPAPVAFPDDAAQRIAAEVCAKVEAEGCLERATALAQAAIERCRNSQRPAACVKEFVVHELRDDDDEDGEDRSDRGDRGDRAGRVVAETCAKAREKHSERFGQSFDSLEACVAALTKAIADCPTEAARKGCAEAALQKAMRKPEEASKLRREAEKALCKAAKKNKERCSDEVLAKARELAERCAAADEPKACLREALKQVRKPKKP